MKHALRLLTLVASLVSFACTTTAPPAATVAAPPAEPIHIVIAGTTDVHGWFEGHERRLEDGTPINFGGLDLLGGYLANLRAANPGRVLLVDSGDMYQGTLASNLSEGAAITAGYNELGYTAVAIGNHEFDFGPVGERPLPREPGDDPLGALKRNIATARYPFLAANIRERSTGKRPDWAAPSALVEVEGVKIGIIGMITPTTPDVTLRPNVAHLDFLDPVREAVDSAAALRAAGAEVVVLIAHMGGDCRDLEEPTDTTACHQESEAFTLARALPPGTIDVYFAGHTHRQLRHFVNGIAIAQAAAQSMAFSVVDLYFDPATKDLLRDRIFIRPHTMLCEKVFTGTTTCDASLAPKDQAPEFETRTYEGRPVARDEGIRRILEPYVKVVEAKRSERLGVKVRGVFTRDYNRESQIGDLVTDILRTSEPGIDFAFVNSGGIRSELRGPEVTYGDAFAVIPFDNYVAVMTLTGAELLELLRVGTNGLHGIFQVSGLKIVVDRLKQQEIENDSRDRLVSVTDDEGRPIDPKRRYRVITSDFLAIGGDALLPVTETIPRERIEIRYDRLLRDVFIEGLKKLGASGNTLVPRLDGRIVVQNDDMRMR